MNKKLLNAEHGACQVLRVESPSDILVFLEVQFTSEAMEEFLRQFEAVRGFRPLVIAEVVPSQPAKTAPGYKEVVVWRIGFSEYGETEYWFNTYEDACAAGELFQKTAHKFKAIRRSDGTVFRCGEDPLSLVTDVDDLLRTLTLANLTTAQKRALGLLPESDAGVIE